MDASFPWAVRAFVYGGVSSTGSVPTRSEIVTALGADPADVDRALSFLEEAYVLALDTATGEIRMAHPFSSVATPFRVETPRGPYWANCAWDAVAIPMLLGTDGATRATCPRSETSIDLRVTKGVLEPVEAVIHFPVPARSFWVDIGFT